MVGFGIYIVVFQRVMPKYLQERWAYTEPFLIHLRDVPSQLEDFTFNCVPWPPCVPGWSSGMLNSLLHQCKQRVKEEIPLFFAMSSPVTKQRRYDFIQYWLVYSIYYPSICIKLFLCTTEISFDKVEFVFLFVFFFLNTCQQKTEFNLLLQTIAWFWHVYFIVFLSWPQAATASVLRFPTCTSAVWNGDHWGTLCANNSVLQTALSISRIKRFGLKNKSTSSSDVQIVRWRPSNAGNVQGESFSLPNEHNPNFRRRVAWPPPARRKHWGTVFPAVQMTAE